MEALGPGQWAVYSSGVYAAVVTGGDLGYWLCVEVHLGLWLRWRKGLRAEDKGGGTQDRCSYGRISPISLRFKVMS